MADPLFAARNLEKSYFGVKVLHGVSLDVAAGEVVGLVGENGSGKSTTMNILSGITQRDAGEMEIAGTRYDPQNPRDAEKARIAFIQQELNIFPNLSVQENLLIHSLPTRGGFLPFLSRGRMREKAAACLRLVNLNVDPGLSAGRLPPGERQLLEVAKALAVEARLMIFDEPTTSLTLPERQRLFALIDMLKANGLGIIYISHVLDDVMQLSDRVTVLRDGSVVLAGDRSSLSIDQLIRAMVGRSVKALYPSRSREASSGVRLAVSHLTSAGILNDVSIEVHAGEVLGGAGMMGCGRTELARAVFWLYSYDTGSVSVDGTSLARADIRSSLDAGMAFLTEDRRDEGLLMRDSVGSNLAIAALASFATRPFGFINERKERAAVSTMSAQLNVAARGRDAIGVAVQSLSGGNQQKVVLGKWLLRSPSVLLLDEPTRGVDVGAKEELYRLIAALADDGMAILLISSEIEELVGLADRIVVIRRGEISVTFDREEFDQESILRAATAAE